MIAACIVCTAGGIVALRAHALHSLDVRSVHASGAPTLGRRQGRSHFKPGPLVGDAPWALSALPECLSQQNAWHGSSVAQIRSHVPADARSLRAGSLLQYRDCTLWVRKDDAIVARGSDRFHIPPHTSFLIAGNELILLRQDGQAELRIYTPSSLR